MYFKFYLVEQYLVIFSDPWIAWKCVAYFSNTRGFFTYLLVMVSNLISLCYIISLKFSEIKKMTQYGLYCLMFCVLFERMYSFCSCVKLLYNCQVKLIAILKFSISLLILFCLLVQSLIEKRLWTSLTVIMDFVISPFSLFCQFLLHLF